jgi:hypothetical protein
MSDATEKAAPVAGKWFGRNVFGFGVTSLFSDFCHEMATAILPQFMQAIGASGTLLMALTKRPASPSLSGAAGT